MTCAAWSRGRSCTTRGFQMTSSPASCCGRLVFSRDACRVPLAQPRHAASHVMFGVLPHARNLAACFRAFQEQESAAPRLVYNMNVEAAMDMTPTYLLCLNTRYLPPLPILQTVHVLLCANSPAIAAPAVAAPAVAAPAAALSHVYRMAKSPP